MHDFITERLPMAVSKSCAALDSITATAWNIAKNTDDDRVKLNALTLIKETEKDKIDIVSNVNLVDQVIDAAEQKQRVAIPTIPTPSEEEEQAIADEYIRDTKYSEKEEDSAPVTRARAIPVDDPGEDR